MVRRFSGSWWNAAALSTALAAVALAAGCVLADPRPDPWNSPSGAARGADNDGFFSGLPPSAGAGEDTEAPDALLDLATVAVSGGGTVPAPVSILGFSAAPGPGGVEIENLAAGGGRSVGFVEGSGSFALEIDAAAGDLLVLRYLMVDGGSVTVTNGDVYVVPVASASPVSAVGAADFTVTAPDASGVVVLSAAAGAATPGSIVSVGNFSNAGTAQAVAGLDGSFSLSLLADTGDRLTVFTASNLDPTAATTAVGFAVP